MRAAHALPFLLALASPGASALGIIPVVENGHADDCAAVLPCPLSYDVADPGAGEVNVTQDLSSNGVVLASPWVQLLLPDGGLFVRGDDVGVPNVIFPFLAEDAGEVNSSIAGTPYVFLVFSRDNMTYGYYGPTTNDTDFAHRDADAHYSDSDRGVFYDRIVVSNPGATSTDTQLGWFDVACGSLPDEVSGSCAQQGSLVTATAREKTPNVRVGLTWEEAGLGDARSDFIRKPATSGSKDAPPHAGPILSSAHAPVALDASAPWAPPRMPSPHAEDTPSPEAAREPPPPAASPPPIATAAARGPATIDAAHPVARAAGALALAIALKLLYGRISSREHALAHASRQRVLDILQAAGPLTVTDLARQLAVDRSTALYHIRVLRRSASVQVARRGRLVYVALPHQTPPTLPASFREGAAAIVLAALRSAGGALPRAELHAHAAAVPQRQRNHILRQLTEAGVLERAFVGNAEVVRVAALERGPRSSPPAAFK